MTKVNISHHWLSTEIWEPEKDRIYLVECADGYVTKGEVSGAGWWVYRHKNKELHPTPQNNPVINFCDLPERAPLFSASLKRQET